MPTPSDREPGEKDVRLAAQLYQCRDSARNLLGANYQHNMELWAAAIRGVAETDRCSELASATKMAREVGGLGAALILAAFVEMTEPYASLAKDHP